MPAAHPQPASEPEVVDAVAVEEPSRVPAVARASTPAPVVRRAAVVAATSFVAGAATIAVARVARRGGLRRRRRRSRALGQVVTTRSFLVDVHVLAPRD